MNESPIMFTKKAVLAILEGCKVEHRVVVNPQPADFHKELQYPAVVVVQDSPLVRVERQDIARWWQYMGEATTHSKDAISPLGGPGAIVWSEPKTRLTGVRVERLQDMNRAAAFLEGCPQEIAGKDGDIQAAHFWFRELWDMQNPKHQWTSNPWVWVYNFEQEPA